MNAAKSQLADTHPNEQSRDWLSWAVLFATLLMLAMLTVVGIKGLSGARWVLVIGAVTAPIIAYGIVTRPQISTYLAVFLLYANLPVVAMKFHGIPFVVAAAVPGLLLIPIFHTVIYRREVIILPPITILIALWVAVQALGTMFSTEPSAAMSGLFRSLTQGIAVFILLINAVRTPQDLRGVTWALLVAGAVMGAACVHQYATGSYHKTYGGFAQLEDLHGHSGVTLKASADRRTAGTIGEKNRFAQNMLLLLPIGLFFWAASESPGIRFIIAALTVMTLLGWAVAFSRGSAIGLVLTAMFGVSTGCLKFKHLAVVFVTALVLLVAMPRYQARLTSLVSLTGLLEGKRTLGHTADGSIRGRFTEMLAAGRVFVDHPLVGVGPSVFPYYAQDYGRQGGLRALETKRQSHSLYLGIAAEQGILGFICFLAIAGMTLRDLLRVRRKCLIDAPSIAHLASGFALALVGYLASGLFLHFSFVRFFWLILGLATATICVANRLQNESTDDPSSSLQSHTALH